MALRILVADRDKRNLAQLHHALDERAHEIVEVTSAGKVVEAFLPGRFDLIVLSMDLPDIDAFYLLEGIRSVDPDVPVFMIGGDCSARMKALSWGASGVLAKINHGPGTTVVVAGSLYLVGAVKALLERETKRR